MAYIGSGSIEFQGTRVELRKRLLISGSIGANTKAFLNGSAQIRLSGGDGGPALGSITTTLGVDHPWESYMELDCSRVAADTGLGGNINFLRVAPGDYPGQIVNMAITVPSSGNSNNITLFLSGSPGNAAAGYAALFADGIVPSIGGTGLGGLGHLGAAWQMIWTGTYWVLTQKNNHVATADMG